MASTIVNKILKVPTGSSDTGKTVRKVVTVGRIHRMENKTATQAKGILSSAIFMLFTTGLGVVTAAQVTFQPTLCSCFLIHRSTSCTIG